MPFFYIFIPKIDFLLVTHHSYPIYLHPLHFTHPSTLLSDHCPVLHHPMGVTHHSIHYTADRLVCLMPPPDGQLISNHGDPYFFNKIILDDLFLFNLDNSWIKCSHLANATNKSAIYPCLLYKISCIIFRWWDFLANLFWSTNYIMHESQIGKSVQIIHFCGRSPPTQKANLPFLLFY